MSSSTQATIIDLPYLLDRRRKKSHAWPDALTTMQMSGVPGASAVANNWRMDPRVDEKREQQLNDSGLFPSSTRNIAYSKAIKDYFQCHLCRSPAKPPLADYVENANEGNLIPPSERPSPNCFLLHLASVNRLLARALRGDNLLAGDFQLALRSLIGGRIPTSFTKAMVSDLVGSLARKGPDTVKEFARCLSDALGDREPPWWATFAHEIGDLSGKTDWAFAAQATGQGQLDEGEWLLAWRYSPEIIGKLYRPSVAEAGDYAFHFPSPQSSAYGITMPLAQSMPTVREVIHPPLKGKIVEEMCTGFFGRIESPLTHIRNSAQIDSWLDTRRTEHAYKLAINNPAIRPWLQRHGMAL